MDKVLTFFAAPLTAFFMPAVYRNAAKSSPARGLLYQLYLTGLVVLVAAVALGATLMPKADGFAKWMGENLPPMIWTPEAGLSMESDQTPQPFLLEHPEFGAIAIIDTKRIEPVRVEDMGDAYAFVTADKFYARNAAAKDGVEVRSLKTTPRPGSELPKRVRITGDVVLKFYNNLRSVMAPMLLGVLLVGLYLFFIVLALLHSIAALVFDSIRKSDLGYGALFNLSCFSMSTGFTVTWFNMLPFLRSIPIPVVVVFLLNLGYLFFAVKVAGPKKEEGPSVKTGA